MMMTRRDFIQAAGTALIAYLPALRSPVAAPAISIVLAPSNLGLRPLQAGHQPGTWQAPRTLMAANLAGATGAGEVLALERPAYAFEAQPDTHLRNGQSIRAFSMPLAKVVRDVLDRGRFPLVIGGDCSILLGALYGLRRAGGRGLVHVDGHSDFYQLDAHDTSSLGSVAGMDLALASGRGEALLTRWPEISAPLVCDEDIIQMGERESPVDRDQIPGSEIAQITAQHMLAEGIGSAASRAVAKLEAAGIRRAWLHVDLDVLDQDVMAAVDSPGSPGLDFAQLAALVHTLCASGRIAGADFAIYDPERDPGQRHAQPIVECIARGLAGLNAPSAGRRHGIA